MVGGVECDVGDDYRGAVSIDLRALDRVVEIDRVSRAARIQAGVYGPALEDQLRPHGLTLRHFPQSFEFSTLGGWLATRSGGHYATLHTHIDDFVESIRAITPHGAWESRRLPGSGAGPSPDRALLGSEGILGVITEAWMRVQDRPTFRASATARFADFDRGRRRRARGRADRPVPGELPAARSRSRRSSPAPTSRATRSCCSRSSRPTIRSTRGSHAPSSASATTAATSTDDAIVVRAEAAAGAREGAAGNWRNAFVRAPYTRDALVVARRDQRDVRDRVHVGRVPRVARRRRHATCSTPRSAVGAWPAVVTCRFTHVYPDGPAPYFTVLALGREPEQLAQWAAIKAAAGDALDRGTAARSRTITRSAAITARGTTGNGHRPFAVALHAAKRALDPAGILNPGVLIDP